MSIMTHPVFGSSTCRTCGRSAELVYDPYYRWRCCGQSWVEVGSAMDVANELKAASDNELKAASDEDRE